MKNPSSQPAILIVGRVADDHDSAIDLMIAQGMAVRATESTEAAGEVLAASPIDVLVVPLSMSGALGLLTSARDLAPSTRLLGVSIAGAEELTEAYRAGALRVLTPPLAAPELAKAVRLALDSPIGLHGLLHRLSLIDVLQMFHQSAQSVHLHLHGPIEGEISLLHGNLVDARCGAVAGSEALSALLATQVGYLESSTVDHERRTISGPFDHVLLDALRTLDEANRGDKECFELDDDWFSAPAKQEVVDRDELRSWLNEFSPGAGVWLIDLSTGAVERLDEPGAHPEMELAGPPGSIGWAGELAERADPNWTRVELISGSTGIALVRVRDLTFAFARLITGTALHRRFHADVARLTSWLSHHVESRR
ncbi:MAG: DUF4388 domain-containing protein [Kofleriaceae bacterium]